MGLLLRNTNQSLGRTRIYLNSALPPVSDPDAQAFLTAASITDITQRDAVNQLTISYKEEGIWTKSKVINPFVGSTAFSHKWNLKDPRNLNAAYRLSFLGGWTHDANGIQGNGTNGYADTFLNLSTDLTLNSAHYSMYITNTTVSGIDMGVTNGGTGYTEEGWCASSFSGTAYGGFYNQAEGGVAVSNADSKGFYVSSVTSPSNSFMTKNNTTLGTTVASSIPANATIYIGAVHDANGDYPQFYSNHQFAFTSIGDGLTNAEALTLYSIVQTFQTALGRQV